MGSRVPTIGIHRNLDNETTGLVNLCYILFLSTDRLTLLMRFESDKRLDLSFLTTKCSPSPQTEEFLDVFILFQRKMKTSRNP